MIGFPKMGRHRFIATWPGDSNRCEVSIVFQDWVHVPNGLFIMQCRISNQFNNFYAKF